MTMSAFSRVNPNINDGGDNNIDTQPQMPQMSSPRRITFSQGRNNTDNKFLPIDPVEPRIQIFFFM